MKFDFFIYLDKIFETQATTAAPQVFLYLVGGQCNVCGLQTRFEKFQVKIEDGQWFLMNSEKSNDIFFIETPKIIGLNPWNIELIQWIFM